MTTRPRTRRLLAVFTAAVAGLGLAAATPASAEPEPALTVTFEGAGSGTVSGPELECTATCSHPYAPGSEVALTAAPAAGSTFTGWSGACSGTGECKVTMSEDRAVTATFALVTHELTVAVEGTGTGSVTGTGIACPGTCSSSYTEGAAVTLTATPEPGSVFTGWSGACSGSGECKVTMGSDQQVTATFARVSHTLTVSLEGAGAGIVTGSGIACPGTCSSSYVSGTEVTLTATPAAGSAFAGWGGACAGTGACSLTLGADRTVTASFTPVTPAGGGGASTGGSSGGEPGGGGTAASAGPTPAEILARLLAAITPRGKTAKISAILRAHAFTETLTALVPGTATVSWFAVPKGAHLSGAAKARPVLVAIGGLVFASPGTGKLELVLTSAGKALLRKSKRVPLSARSTFVPIHGSGLTVRASFTLHR